MHQAHSESLPDKATVRTRIAETFSYPSRDPKEVIVSAYPGFKDEDLRLPARLYVLRKQIGTDPVVLDRVSGLLRDGACSKARQALDRL